MAITTICFLTVEVALAIIGEYSFLLWDRDKSSRKTCVPAAVDYYKQSPNCNTVVYSVHKVFRQKTDQIGQENNTFALELLQISLDNRLCMLNSD